MEVALDNARQGSAPHSLAIPAGGLRSSPDATLGRCSPDDALQRSAADFAQQLTSGEVGVRRTAAITIARSPMEAAYLGEILRTSLQDDDRQVRSTMASSLGRMGRAGSEFAPDLEDLLRYDADSDVRAGAVRALGMLDLNAERERATCSSVPKGTKGAPRRSSSMGALAGGLGAATSASRNRELQTAASRIANQRGASHTSLLVGALKDGDIKVRTAAEVALRNLHTAAKVRRRSLSRTSKAEKIRQVEEAELCARGLTGELGEDGGLYARLLAQRLDDPDPKVRSWTAETLGIIGPAARPTARALVSMAKDGKENERVQLAAQKASQLILRNPKAEAEKGARGGRRRGGSRSKSAGPKKGGSPPKKPAKKK